MNTGRFVSLSFRLACFLSLGLAVSACRPGQFPTPASTPSLAPVPTLTPAGLPRGPGVSWHLVVISESSGWGVGEAFARQIEKDVRSEIEELEYRSGMPAVSGLISDIRAKHGTIEKVSSYLDEVQEDVVGNAPRP